MLQLEHQLVVQVAADLLWSALEERRRKYLMRSLPQCDAAGLLSLSAVRDQRLTKASGPSSMLLLVQGFQLT